MTCAYHLGGFDDGLLCLRTDDHATGHIFQSAWASDGHDLSEARATA
jgi:hypothetical protein